MEATLLTTQFFTTMAMDDVVFARQPYSEDDGRDTFDESDGIYAASGELTLSRDGGDVITLDVERGWPPAAAVRNEGGGSSASQLVASGVPLSRPRPSDPAVHH